MSNALEFDTSTIKINGTCEHMVNNVTGSVYLLERTGNK